MVLEHAGHDVMTATGERELIAACSKIKFDVAVIGQVVSPVEKNRIMRLIRYHCPDAKVLELFIPSAGKMLPEADDWLEASVTPPVDLVERVAMLASKS